MVKIKAIKADNPMTLLVDPIKNNAMHNKARIKDQASLH